jgi:hypothetical protein
MLNPRDLFFLTTQALGRVTYTTSSRTCSFSEALPTQDGFYTYRVKVSPGELSLNAAFPNNDNEISKNFVDFFFT